MRLKNGVGKADFLRVSARKGWVFLEGKRSEDVRIAASCNLLKRHPSEDKASFYEREKKGAGNKGAEMKGMLRRYYYVIKCIYC